MQDGEAIQMMRCASDEIKVLRGHIGQLAPKADAYDLIHKILDLVPGRSQGMGEDVAYMLDRRIKELEAKLSAPTTSD